MHGLPHHLAQTSAQGLIPGQFVAQFEFGGYHNFIYLIIDWSTQEAAIIDPQKGMDVIWKVLEDHKLTLKQVLLTHTHWDHIAGLPEALTRFPELPILTHAVEATRLKPEFQKNLTPIENGETLHVGKIPVKVFHTPGHSAGEICYFMPDHGPSLFTGDTLFIRDCGRTDLESGSSQEMFVSLGLLKLLPPQTWILPGHHYKPECASTLERELLESPPLLCRTVTELEALP